MIKDKLDANGKPIVQREFFSYKDRPIGKLKELCQEMRNVNYG
jgi:hypothetical protein